MTTGERLFLILAEEKSFHRAAEKAYITQQCLSDHIKRMEEAYGTALFVRRPRVELTAAGRAVERMLHQVSGLERGLQNELAEIENCEAGSLRIGINYTRSPVIVPALWQRYHARHPKVQLEVFTGETNSMQQLLVQGRIDFFLGVNAEISAPLKSRRLMDEGIYLLSTPACLKEHFGEDAELLLTRKRPILPAEFGKIPLVSNHLQSTTWALLSDAAEKAGVRLRPSLHITDYNALSEICRGGAFAFFCPQFFLSGIFEQNRLCSEERRLAAIPVDVLGKPLHFELIYNAAVRYPRCICDAFREIEMLTGPLEELE